MTDNTHGATRIAATRRIAASAPAIFAIVSSPAGHVRIDGSGMLTGTIDDRALTAVGDTFDMDMDRRPLGDIPNLAEYKVRNTVTQLVPDRLFEWGIGSAERGMFGHVYGWALEPVGDDETVVTNYCDWSAIPEEMSSRRSWPIVPLEMLERSVENLQRIVTTG